MKTKKWLIPLLGLALALTTVGAAFAINSDGSHKNDQDVTDEWKPVEASGWPGGFSLLLREGWQLNELQGIDSYVGEIIWSGGRMTFDFGWYSNSLADDEDPQYIVTYEEIGGRRAKLVRPRVEGDGLITGVYFEDFDGSNLDIPSQNRLQISGVGLTSDLQETAFALFRTIRPVASESQGDSEPSGDYIVTSIDDIDPDVCDLIHNINGCTPEELEEMGMAPVTGSIAVGEYYPVPDLDAKPEPFFPDGGAQYEVQSHEEAVAQDCGLAGGAVYITSDGEVGCTIFHDGGKGGLGETPAQPPAILPTPETQPSAG